MFQRPLLGVTRASSHDQYAASIISAHFSPIMMQAAFVLPETTVGMIEASATRKPETACTRSQEQKWICRVEFLWRERFRCS
jgi:hypothetical protein